VEIVRWEHRPSLRKPVMVAAFEGWNDAGDAASTAARYLSRSWEAQRFAVVDAEEFYDFTVTRPQVRLVDGITRRIDWPTNELASCALPGAERDVAFLHGIEPQLRWRTFAAGVVDVARTLQVELVLTLGALIADVPHTRPVRVTGTAADPALVQRLGLQRSQYEGPTGIVGVLHDALSHRGIASASLWATVPHYISQTPSPKAALALVQRTAGLLGVTVTTTDLDVAAAAYERQVNEVVEADDDASAYVRSLEAADDERHDDALPAEGADLAEEVERFLRENG
jgi:proteasome assembly chaperone (PAC2) family protein